LLTRLLAELFNQLSGQAAKLLDQRSQQIGEPKQEASSLLLKSGRCANLAWMAALSYALFAMTVPAENDRVASKRSASDVMEFKAMRIALRAKCTLGVVRAEALQRILTHTFRITIGHGNCLSFNELRDKPVHLLKALAPG
jgi:hypothetical protein